MNPIGSYNTERLYWGWELKTLVKDDSQDFWPEQLTRRVELHLSELEKTERTRLWGESRAQLRKRKV